MNNIQSAFQPLLTLDYIVKQPENKLFDRKSSKVKPGDLAQTISAFANNYSLVTRLSYGYKGFPANVNFRLTA